MTKAFRGIYTIAVSPFDEMGDFMWEDFERECDFIARSGTHGFVWPVMASEFTVISFPERVQGFKASVDAVAGRIPVVAGVADTSTAGAVALAEAAGQAGADAIIAMPPWATKMSNRDLIEDYYRRIAEAAGIPVMIQNCGGALGSAMAGSFVTELCEKIDLVQYLKEETPPAGHSISADLARGSAAVKGVFSGNSCAWLAAEHRRGACGSMPACCLPDVDATIWDLLEEGKEEEAREIHMRKMVVENVLRSMPNRRGRKEFLVKRGALSKAFGRSLGPQELDEIDLAEMDRALELVRPYLRV